MKRSSLSRARRSALSATIAACSAFAIVLTFGILGGTSALAQSAYPSKPVRIIVPTDAGTGTSRQEFTRIIADDTVTWGKAVRATGFKAD